MMMSSISAAANANSCFTCVVSNPPSPFFLSSSSFFNNINKPSPRLVTVLASNKEYDDDADVDVDGNENKNELLQQTQQQQQRVWLSLEYVNPIGLGRKSRQLFDEVWRKFSGLGQISRTSSSDVDIIRYSAASSPNVRFHHPRRSEHHRPS